MSEQLLDSVKARYGAIAESELSSDNAGVPAVAEAFGYTAEELTSIPAEANMVEKADAWVKIEISRLLSIIYVWSGRRDSNPRPSAPKTDPSFGAKVLKNQGCKPFKINTTC